MIAPHLTVKFRGHDFPVAQLGEAWAITVDGAEYFLTIGDPVERAARRFMLERLYSLSEDDYRAVGFIASRRHPLLLSIDERIVRSWPAFIPRSHPTWQKTYINPATGERVLATEGPVWTFAAVGRPVSASTTLVSPDHTVADVRELARAWLAGAD